MEDIDFAVIDKREKILLYRRPPMHPSPLSNDDSHELEQTVRDRLDRGNKIGAITAYRKAPRTGLRDAKRAVEDFEAGKP